MRVFYNEHDPFAAAWLRGLMIAGLIPNGVVDERSIVDLEATDVAGFDACHFFAGIGGWPHALDLAGWDRPVWTGSCPCQPLSSAGQRKGHADERHLWPAFHRLIAECKPATIFGEQVASKDGREWLAGIRADLEALGYACGAADLCAAGVGAPHIRQRLYWVADSGRERRDRQSVRLRGERPHEESDEVAGGGSVGRMGNPAGERLEGERGQYRTGSERNGGLAGPAMQADIPQWNGATIAIERQDGSCRVAAEPALFPMAARIPGDVGRLRGSGNSIVPQVAAEFVSAFMECAP